VRWAEQQLYTNGSQSMYIKSYHLIGNMAETNSLAIVNIDVKLIIIIIMPLLS
jgi:hypothetical protein